MKRFTALLLTTLLWLQVAADIEDIWIVPNDENSIFNDEQTYGGLWTQGVFPGLKMRISRGFVDLVHKNLLEYGASYINYAYKFKKNGEFHLNVFPLNFDFKYDNLEHDRIQLDLNQFHFDFIHSPKDGTPVVYMQLPMVDSFGYRFDYEWKAMAGILGGKGHMHLKEHYSIGIATVHLGATEKGHLYPQLHALKMHMGRSEVNVANNTVKSYLYGSTFNVLKNVGMSAINNFGKTVYNQMLPEFTRRYFND